MPTGPVVAGITVVSGGRGVGVGVTNGVGVGWVHPATSMNTATKSSPPKNAIFFMVDTRQSPEYNHCYSTIGCKNCYLEFVKALKRNY